jgi:hypothetical protein
MLRRHRLALALPTLFLGIASVVWLPPADASARDKVIYFEGNGTVQRRLPPGSPQTGDLTGAGIMNSTFQTVSDDTTIFPDPERDNESMSTHIDRYESTTSTHVDPDGKTRRDSFNVTYTVVLLAPDATRTSYWVTFQGPMSDGTGIFAGATGVFNGHAHSVQPVPDGLQYLLRGKVGGEVHLTRAP